MQHNLLKRVILEQHEVIRRAEIVPRNTSHYRNPGLPAII